MIWTGGILWSVKWVNGAGAPIELTEGSGIEWNPVFLGATSKIAYIGSDATHPGQLYVADASGKGQEAGFSGFAGNISGGRTGGAETGRVPVR